MPRYVVYEIIVSLHGFALFLIYILSTSLGGILNGIYIIKIEKLSKIRDAQKQNAFGIPKIKDFSGFSNFSSEKLLNKRVIFSA